MNPTENPLPHGDSPTLSRVRCSVPAGREDTALPLPGERTLVWAHRGFMAKAPQNTLSAFDLAWESGADGIELDVQRSADGAAVVFHDDSLERLTDGTGAVSDHPLDYLKKLDAGTRFSRRFSGERIPLLSEALAARPPRGFVNIEIKTPLESIPTAARALRLFTGYPALTEGRDTERWNAARLAAECVANAVNEAFKRDPSLRAHLVVSSFNPLALSRFTELLPQVPVGFLYCGNTKLDTRPLASRLLGNRIAAFHPAVRETGRTLIGQEHAAGRRVYVWTVRHDLDALRLARSGADSLIGNDPEHILRVLKRAGLR